MRLNRSLVMFLAIMLLIILGLILIFTSGGGKKATPKSNASTILALPDYATTDATTVVTIDGQVNGDESHSGIRITIGQSEREVDILQGYSGKVVNTYSFYNTQDAYAVFLRSINYSNFLAKQKNPKVPDDERGLCPLGDRYIFELNNNGTDLNRTWASTCGPAVGTSAANTGLILTLFENQIPNYQSLVGNVRL